MLQKVVETLRKEIQDLNCENTNMDIKSENVSKHEELKEVND